jgi:DNA topoisomerase I
MVAFAHDLPALRERVESDLARRGLVRERVLACALRLLDLGLFRIGSERYASSNGTQGLATLERSHVRLERGRAVFDYTAKGSQRHR